MGASGSDRNGRGLLRMSQKKVNLADPAVFVVSYSTRTVNTYVHIHAHTQMHTQTCLNLYLPHVALPVQTTRFEEDRTVLCLEYFKALCEAPAIVRIAF